MVQVKVQVCTVDPTSCPTCIPFVPCQSALPLLRCGYLKIDFENFSSKPQMKSRSTSHIGSNNLSTRVSFVPWQSTLLFLIYSIPKFDLENPRWRSWVRSKFNKLSQTSYRPTSLPFFVKRPPHSRVTAFSICVLKIQGQCHSSR